ncbi:hypothetical protein FRAHR75_200004 [Frankia sp. Hr75.2]|nr:hypothetical protein FRAHR75_200004 [Frankia sp. Hr75.2]
MATHLRTELITDAFTTATSRTTLTQNAIFHSDRGAQRYVGCLPSRPEKPRCTPIGRGHRSVLG